MLDGLEELGLEARVGIEAGEVVADETESTFATGEAVNIAARLQQEAAAGRDRDRPGRPAARRSASCADRGSRPARAARAARAAPGLARDGRSHDGAPRRSLAAPFVGREAELELLENTFARAVRDGRAYLFTIYGEPGVGKSRLAREFLVDARGLDDAPRPLAARTARASRTGRSPRWSSARPGSPTTTRSTRPSASCAPRCEDEAVADLLGLASGVLEAVRGERSQQEIAWAAREWAEKLALEQPLVLVFEDIHWAEDPLLELIEHLASWVRQAPLLLVCLARPELLDVRPGWGGGRLRATSIELEPLAAGGERAARRRARRRRAACRPRRAPRCSRRPRATRSTSRRRSACWPSRARRRRRRADPGHAAGADRGPHRPARARRRRPRCSAPPWSAGSSGAARSSTSRPRPASSTAVLDDLVLRDFLVEEPRSTIRGETAYRFKHVLIREVAYSGLSKSARAELHATLRGLAARARGRGAARDPRVPPRPGGGAARGARRRAAARARRPRPPRRWRRRAGARWRARRNRSARKLLLRAVELEPTLRRRFLAAKAAWRLADLPAVSRRDGGGPRRRARGRRRRARGPRAHRARRRRRCCATPTCRAARELVEHGARRASTRAPAEARFDALQIRAVDRLVPRRPRRRRALRAGGARRRPSSRAQGLREHRRRRARGHPHGAARAGRGRAVRRRARWSSPRRAAARRPRPRAADAGRAARAARRRGRAPRPRYAAGEGALHRGRARRGRSASCSPARPGSSGVAATCARPSGRSASRSGS